MTNPILSLTTTEQIGRVYQQPGGQFSKKLSTRQVREGLTAGLLSPSITNVINVFNKDLEGYATFMMGKALEAGKPRYEAAKEYITYRDMCADRGSRVHKAIEDFIDAGFGNESWWTFMAHKRFMDLPSYIAMVEADPFTNDLTYFNAFLKFIKEHKPKFISQEATVYGVTEDGLSYAGTTDFIAEINGRTVVGDWKTSSKMSTTVALQLAAVINAQFITTDFETLLPVPKIDAAIGVHLGKDGEFGVYEADTVRGWEQFQSCRRLWEHYAFKGEYDEGTPLIKKV